MAKRTKKRDWRLMTTAVLKNRLLTITDGAFDESDYGFRNMNYLARALPDILRLHEASVPAVVELLVELDASLDVGHDIYDQDSSAQAKPLAAVAPSWAAETPSPPILGDWIRPDLWWAVLAPEDRPFVWDESMKRAVPAEPADGRLRLPTLLTQSQQDDRRLFARANWPATFDNRSNNLEHWIRTGAIDLLPYELRRRWSKFLASRAIPILQHWFANNDPEALTAKAIGAGATAAAPESSADENEYGTSLDRLFDEAHQLRVAGDLLGAGEVIAASLPSLQEDDLDPALARIIAYWASPEPRAPSSLSELANSADEFASEDLAIATIHAFDRASTRAIAIPKVAYDLAYRVEDAIVRRYDLDAKKRIGDICAQAVAKLRAARAAVVSSVESFLRTSSVTAKGAAIDVLRRARALAPLSLGAERAHLRDAELLLGAAFRKFCESCERNEAVDIVRRASVLREHIARSRPAIDDVRSRGFLWQKTVQPLLTHTEALLDEASQRSEAITAPDLQLATTYLKCDLSVIEKQRPMICRVLNQGSGRAIGVGANFPLPPDATFEIDLLDPLEPFDLAQGTERLVKIGITVHRAAEAIAFPIRWHCSSAIGRPCEFLTTVSVEQQQVQPNWDVLTQNPPYTTNPIRIRASLFGRDRILSDLLIHVSGRTSTFLWGQKRVGKTSLLQVLASELNQRPDTLCIVLRMGELSSLHEGQIAHRIAERITSHLQWPANLPREEDFGAGMGRLIPFAEQVSARYPTTKIAIVVDEFDDIDSSLYIGERGRQFIKALRSLSEVGLAFFFVGSERMSAIYERHQADLNKWIHVSLDRIADRDDCRALITAPVTGVLEYEDSAVDFIADYCMGNPFYIHVLCFELFKRCAQEQRTFISAADIQIVRDHLLRALGATNFAHFWDDNPELDASLRSSQAAENCLVLSCLATLGGACESYGELEDVPARLELPAGERMPSRDFRIAVERLRQRNVLHATGEGGAYEITLPIFRDWLRERWESDVLLRWKDYIRNRPSPLAARQQPIIAVETTPFPIPEDDLLAVSQRLVYCAKQKDVAEVKRWLRQFDDDSRIEIAFALLRRLAEKGMVLEGDRVRALQTIHDLISRRRSEVGVGAWRIARARLDNLCITFVDSETKSGAAVARDLQKQVRAGKCGSASEITHWLRAHAEDDAILLVADDFAGTGGTLIRGISALVEANETVMRKLLRERRVSCYIMFAFPEAIAAIRSEFPDIDIAATKHFGDDVRAFDSDPPIFESDSETRYAQEVMLQIGRELVPQHPLGFGDMAGLVVFHNTIPNNTLPVFWSNGQVNERPWLPLFPRA